MTESGERKKKGYGSDQFIYTVSNDFKGSDSNKNI
jgi:hypothetical protein